ncbi:hypothetical protein [Amycolatopsis taiwanensis]|uniref:Uncharacterized protein n=1 Tax=Amycolatopsis taiwanensis TaxID=342230 RepID=A0A9W6QXG4_9PSEU|nr:hypothetical protein [Amycolatopsis taiwanensis]GLY63842.1 hypothetical protein Atai01_04610 [Amycolatopsis taiwanensis]
MKVTTRAARNLVGAGLVGGLVWSVVVEAAMPSWFDPGDSCPGVTTVEQHYFPPGAKCVYEGGRSVDYVPWAKTVILTVVIVLLAVMTMTGLVVLGWRLLRRGQTDLGEPKPKRPALHVLGAAMLGVATVAIVRAVIIIALLMGGPPGGATAFVIVALGAIGSASALDRAVGPGRGGSAGSRRRGTVLVVTAAAAMVSLVVATWSEYAQHNTLLGPGWAIAVSGGVFAVLAAAQWIPTGRRSVRTT